MRHISRVLQAQRPADLRGLSRLLSALRQLRLWLPVLLSVVLQLLPAVLLQLAGLLLLPVVLLLSDQSEFDAGL